MDQKQNESARRELSIDDGLISKTMKTQFFFHVCLHTQHMERFTKTKDF